MVKRLLAVLAVLLATLLPATPASAQSSNLSQREILALINQLRRQRVITNATVGPTISAILNGTIDLGDLESAGLIKRRLTAGIGKAKLKKLAEAANPPDGALLTLLHVTSRSVMNNLTDAGLKAAVAQRGRAVKLRTAKVFASRALTIDHLRVLEHYPPERAAEVLDVIASVAFVRGELPYGAPDTTWASESFWEVNFEARKVEFAKKSVVARLLANLGWVNLPTEVEAEFVWSGWNPVVIDLSFERWTASDIPELTRLLDNPYYGAAAQAQLEALK